MVSFDRPFCFLGDGAGTDVEVATWRFVTLYHKIPLWTTLVLSGFTGSIMAMLAQLMPPSSCFHKWYRQALRAVKQTSWFDLVLPGILIFTLVVMVAGVFCRWAATSWWRISKLHARVFGH